MFIENVIITVAENCNVNDVAANLVAKNGLVVSTVFDYGVISGQVNHMDIPNIKENPNIISIKVDEPKEMI